MPFLRSLSINKVTGLYLFVHVFTTFFMYVHGCMRVYQWAGCARAWLWYIDRQQPHHHTMHTLSLSLSTETWCRPLRFSPLHDLVECRPGRLVRRIMTMTGAARVRWKDHAEALTACQPAARLGAPGFAWSYSDTANVPPVRLSWILSHPSHNGREWRPHMYALCWRLILWHDCYIELLFVFFWPVWILCQLSMMALYLYPLFKIMWWCMYMVNVYV